MPQRMLALAILSTLALALSPARAEPTPRGCIPSTAASTCCPGACTVRHGSGWAKADRVLRSCLRALECSERDVASATVSLRCGC